MASFQGFYSNTSVETTDSGTTVVVRINEMHPVFAGHFPGQPVASGAMLTQMVIDEASALLGGSLHFVGARQIKFLSVLNPMQTTMLRLEYVFAEREGKQQFTCSGINGGITYFKINGAFA